MHCVLSFRVSSYKINIRHKFSLPVPLFHVVLHHISFYIIRYHFLQLFSTKTNIFWKNIFVKNFDLTNSPTPHSWWTVCLSVQFIIPDFINVWLSITSSFWSFIVPCSSLILLLPNKVSSERLFRYGTSISRCLAT